MRFHQSELKIQQFLINILIKLESKILTVTDNPVIILMKMFHPLAYLIFPASYPCLTSWQQLARIMFLTTIPVYPETVSNNLPQIMVFC